MAWARISAGTIWKLAAKETGPGTIVEPRRHASAGLEQLEISARSDMPDPGSPEVFVSYAGQTKRWMPPRRARQRQEVVERLCETLVSAISENDDAPQVGRIVTIPTDGVLNVKKRLKRTCP